MLLITETRDILLVTRAKLSVVCWSRTPCRCYCQSLQIRYSPYAVDILRFSSSSSSSRRLFEQYALVVAIIVTALWRNHDDKHM